MKKDWDSADISVLDINGTEYHPQGGTTVDGHYESNDGKYYQYTYGPSSGNGGTPETDVND